MKKILLIVCTLGVHGIAFAQNTYPWISSGNIGIGTSSPASTLHLYGTGATTLNIEGAVINSSYGRLNMYGRPSAAGHSVGFFTVNSTRGGQSPVTVSTFDFIHVGSADDATHIGISTHDGTALTERMRITAAGNVGIGTVNPQSRLEIVDGGGAMIRNTNSLGYSTFRLHNDQNNSAHMLEIDYSGTSYPNSLLIGGPAGESASIGTVGAYPLAFGTTNTARMTILPDGNVGIGTIYSNEKLSVNGKIRAKEVKVEITGWSDYVFEEGYELKGLEKLESFIKQNKHLPEIPSAAEVKENGIELGEMNAKLLKKIEELTLYLIEQNKRSEDHERWRKEQGEKIKEQGERIERQQQEINQLKSKS